MTEARLTMVQATDAHWPAHLSQRLGAATRQSAIVRLPTGKFAEANQTDSVQASVGQVAALAAT